MSKAPGWLESLVDDVASCVEAHNVLGPLGYRWVEEGDMWEVMIYPAPAQLAGGPEDGATVAPGFSLDVHQLCATFEKIVDVHWQAQAFGPHDHTGQHISIEGVYKGHHIFLQVLSEAPDDEEPRFTVDASGGKG